LLDDLTLFEELDVARPKQVNAAVAAARAAFNGPRSEFTVVRLLK